MKRTAINDQFVTHTCEYQLLETGDLMNISDLEQKEAAHAYFSGRLLSEMSQFYDICTDSTNTASAAVGRGKL